MQPRHNFTWKNRTGSEIWTSFLKSLPEDDFSPWLLILSWFQVSYIQLLQRLSLNCTINLLSSNNWNRIMHAYPTTETFYLSMKLNGGLTICVRPSQTHIHKNISSFLFSFLINFISFSHKISKTCFLCVFAFLNVAFGKKVTTSFHFLFIPRGNRTK